MSYVDRPRYDRARRQLARQGYALRKSRARITHSNDFGGYMIVDADRNAVVAGSRFDLTIDDVEKWIADA